MLKVDYPTAQDELTLAGVISIETSDSFDTIYIGHPRNNHCLGYIGSIDDQFMFKADTTMADFPLRNSYEECLLDAFITLANDPDFAQEFAVLTLRKVLDNN